MTFGLSTRACNWNATDSKKNYIRLNYSKSYLWPSKQMSNDFVRSQSVAETDTTPPPPYISHIPANTGH